jgi:hypothetical protein
MNAALSGHGPISGSDGKHLNLSLRHLAEFGCLERSARVQRGEKGSYAAQLVKQKPAALSAIDLPVDR